MNVRQHRWLDRIFPSYESTVILLALVAIVGAVIFELRGCEGDKADAQKVVENAGYTNVLIGGPNQLACSDSDTLSNRFTAHAPNGQAIHGTVCCGVAFKGCTLRFNR